MRVLVMFSRVLWHHLLQCRPWQGDRHQGSTCVNTEHLLNLISENQAEMYKELV